MAWNGAGGWVIFSHDRQVNFSRLRDSIDFARLFRPAQLGQHKPGVAGIGRQRVQRQAPLAPVVGAARRFAVDRSAAPGHKDAIQSSRHRAKSPGSTRFRRSRSQRAHGMPK
jgi:hypothetical protein